MAGRAGGTLSGFLLGSIAVHAAVLVVLPGPGHERVLPHTVALEVVLLRGDDLARSPHELAVPPIPQPLRTEARPVNAPPELRARPVTPVAVMSEPREMKSTAFPGEPAGVPERTVAAPEPTTAGAVAGPPTSSSAAYLRNPAPSYPLASRRAGEQGTVTLRVRVSPDGLATRVAVERSSGSPHLDAAALEAVKAWRFTPARRGTEAIESWMMVPIVFRLEG
ncbi:MAG TPA: energy transducer TonB [Burkholderiales bacterium]|nr:energy transducer TonB [Burkholderiales bacterium]